VFKYRLMNIARRLRELREAKGLSQGDIERRSGLLRSYISRVEGGYTAPSLATLEKFAKALEVEPYQLLYSGKGRPRAVAMPREPGPSRPVKRLVKLFESAASEDSDEVFATLSKVFSKL
jgi:transcriptional regulator with XRE-family HTH domain